MRCPHCAHPNPDAANFCNECGARLAAVSGPPPEPSGYTPGHLAATVLRNRSALEGERKQVTVLFADLEGSVALAGHFDPEQWHRVLDRFFEILTEGVHRFEGTINQYTGDGIMALFGAPLAHEDHAQRACHAALRIGAGLRDFEADFERRHGRRFPVRMGLHCGEVVVGRIGDDLRMDYTAQGHVVGLAARLQEAAPGGGIYLSQSIEERVRGYFRTREVGLRELSGAAGPARVYALEGAGPVRTRLEVAAARGFSPFVGRLQPMATLEKALEHVGAGGGVVVGVEGEAGVGKSRLCHEFARRCRRRGVTLFQVQCPSHGASIPHLAVRGLLRDLLGLDASVPEPERRGSIAARLDALVDGRTAAVVLDLLGEDESAQVGSRPEPGERDARVAEALVALLRSQTSSRPAALAIDDLHWIDARSEAILGEVARAAAGMPLLLLANFRPEHRAAWTDLPHYHELGLLPLSEASSGDLLDALLGADSSTYALGRRIQEAAAGNPFFIEELVRCLAEAGHLSGEPGRYRASDDADLAIPETVRQVVAARIDRLADLDKALLQVASVIGQSFSLALLSRVAPLPEKELEAALSRLEASRFVWREMQLRRGDFSFTHSLTREVANGSLLAERRAALHKLVASALEESPEGLGERAALIAHHWEAAGDGREAARWRLRAGFRVANLVPRRRWSGPAQGGPGGAS